MKLTKILTFFSILSLTFACGSWAIYYTFVKQNRKYVFANWESYMSPAVQNYLSDKYDINFVNFSTNSDLVGLYMDASYDMAVPSGYIIPQLVKNNSLSVLDWSQFKGHSDKPLLNPSQMGDYYRCVNNCNSDDAKKPLEIQTIYPNNVLCDVLPNDPINLFNNVAQQFIINSKSYNNQPFNLLKYGVPYFMEDLVFAYRGPEIQELSQPNIGWNDILKQGNKFKNNLEVIDDERNIYSIARTIETNNTINPNNSDDFNFENTFNQFKNNINKFGNVLWDSDSKNVLSYLSAWNKNNSPRAAILYNGDAVYSSTYTLNGLGEISNLSNWHIVHPKTTVNVIDFVTMSNKIKDKVNAYKLIDELCLSGSKISAEDNTELHNSYCSIYDNKTQPAPNWNNYVKNQNSDLSTYNYLSMQNFDGVNYISPLKQFDYDDAKKYYSDYNQWGDRDIGYYLFWKNIYRDNNNKLHLYDHNSYSHIGEPIDDKEAQVYTNPIELYHIDNGIIYDLKPIIDLNNYPINLPMNGTSISLNNINNETIEVPFTDKQQFYSLRYYIDIKNNFKI